MSTEKLRGTNKTNTDKSVRKSTLQNISDVSRLVNYISG